MAWLGCTCGRGGSRGAGAGKGWWGGRGRGGLGAVEGGAAELEITGYDFIGIPPSENCLENLHFTTQPLNLATVSFSRAVTQRLVIHEVDGVNHTSTIGEPLPEPSFNQRLERSIFLVQEENNEQKFEVSTSVASQGKVTFYLTYEELLRRVNGRYLHTVQVRPGQLLVFSADVKSLGQFNGTRSHKKKVKRMMKRLEPMGNSYLNPAYHEALRRATGFDRKNVARKVVMVSDGWGTLGQTDPEVIRATLRAANTFNIPIFGVVFGPDADLRLIEQVSADSGAWALRVFPRSGVKEQVRRFFQEISSPLLVDVAMSYPQEQIYEELPMVTAGVLVPNTPNFHPVVTGRGRFGPERLEVTRIDSRYQNIAMGGVGIVSRIWAYLKVQDLLAKMAASEDPSVIVRLHYTLQDLATRNRFVTEYTPLMVMLPNLGYELVYPQKARKRHKNDYTHSQGPINKTFVVGDPNFIVHTRGVRLPFCFDYHGYNGAFLSLIQDPYTSELREEEPLPLLRQEGPTLRTEE
ncbi:putative inter-alpha-trypsin inhibitor heavy chain H3-like [Penaeus vannamei]|uniref:Putative inter-alpha-trypsin inhibitor heavy chain H3-like n=1 Tax=Penaeus vannamei TaxID=6689 RepID=A0A3R7N2L6_PENVA|nr:putative inter-alpha-trypsin inhibitor heavy chain H3-like [Penaeus vannamei]